MRAIGASWKRATSPLTRVQLLTSTKYFGPRRKSNSRAEGRFRFDKAGTVELLKASG